MSYYEVVHLKCMLFTNVTPIHLIFFFKKVISSLERWLLLQSEAHSQGQWPSRGELQGGQDSQFRLPMYRRGGAVREGRSCPLGSSTLGPEPTRVIPASLPSPQLQTDSLLHLCPPLEVCTPPDLAVGREETSPHQQAVKTSGDRHGPVTLSRPVSQAQRQLRSLCESDKGTPSGQWGLWVLDLTSGWYFCAKKIVFLHPGKFSPSPGPVAGQAESCWILPITGHTVPCTTAQLCVLARNWTVSHEVRGPPVLVSAASPDLVPCPW